MATPMRLVLGAAVLLALIVVPVAVAGTGGDSASPEATASVSVKKKVKKLNKKLKQLARQLAELERQPGPQGDPGQQGPQGEQGEQGEQGTPGSANAWALLGNAGTTSANFLGTTDNQALNLRVNNARALRLEPASDGTNQSPNLIAGQASNTVTPGVHSATIAGGGRATPADPATANRVTDNGGTVGGGASNQAGDANPVNRPYATVGGGVGNTASLDAATVGGGFSSTARAVFATVGGGALNTASGASATAGGGFSNTASGVHATASGGGSNTASGVQATASGGGSNTAGADFATVGGGESNSASQVSATVSGGTDNAATGTEATVPGGSANTAGGDLSFAAGNRAKANHQGAFVWADSQDEDMASSNNNQFIVRAQGGFYLQNDSSLDQQLNSFLNTSTTAFLSAGGTWVDASDESRKEGFEAIEPREVLDKVAELPVRSWAYKAEPGVRHIGPTGQDFHAAFGLGADDKHIAALDANGVALAAIKGLNRELQRERRRRVAQVARLEARIAGLERNDR
jgi:hypothetical protein